MINIDFSKLKVKYPILNDSDIGFLNEFFNRKEILERFEMIEEERKKRFMIFMIVEAIFLMASFGYLGSIISDFSANNIFGVLVVLSFLSFFIYLIIGIFFRDRGKEMKSVILPKFASEINPDLKYDMGKQFYFGNEPTLVACNLLEQYDRVDLIEDSILYEPIMDLGATDTNKSSSGSIGIPRIAGNIIEDTMQSAQSIPQFPEKNRVPYTIEGYEFKSSKKRKDKNGREYYTMNNHCYLLKVKFNNARQKLTSGMTLKRDINENLARKLSRVIGIDLTILGIFLYATQPKEGENLGIELLLATADILNVPFGIFISTLLIMMFVITFQIYSRIINKGRVKTENAQFEKLFDVYCKDQVVSRAVLTPSFMYRIFDYVRKINPNRIYEFFFNDDLIYIKLDLMRGIGSSYMEVSVSSGILANMQKFIEFYIEVKNVTELAKDLGLEYFDKDAFNSQIIK